ncbi:MAG: thiamine-phosphate kinase [Pseudomonadota bacterium]|nr:thiamine-phosphate kinase [Pseudomonadota bacterium]
MSRSGEFEVIDRWFVPLTDEGALGLTDDAAILPDAPPGESWIMTKDAMVAGVHFLPDDPPDLVARKLLRVNLSDLAAMAARPVGYLLATAFTPDQDDDWIAAFARGLAEDQQEFGVHLYGGDTVSTPGPLTLSLTAFGLAPRARLLRRDSARAGDDIWVSGTIGDSALGLRILTGDIAEADPADAAFLADRYRLPRPRLALGHALGGLATAGQDVSDGLVADLGHIADTSRVAMSIAFENVPLSPAAREVLALRPDLALLPLVGGDDYELVFTAPASARAAIADLGTRTGTPVRRIGEVEEGEGVTVTARGEPLKLAQTGWRHF